MNTENSLSNCKLRFKAIENFLRRVAFNLGNTPSQTEVKIISCIPVDVSDLQQKIYQLQKELEESKKSSKKGCPGKTATCHTVICETNCSACRIKHCENANVKLICSNNLVDSSSVSLLSVDSRCSSSKQLGLSITVMNTSQSSSSSKTDYMKTKNTKSWRPRNFLKKKKPCKKCKTHLIYCAKTDTNTPFGNKFNLTNDVTPVKFLKEPNNGLSRFSDDVTSGHISKDATARNTSSRSYFERMVRKQYQPQLIFNGLSNLSEFSSPVCRDNIPNHSKKVQYESDICSCFHDRFQNIDKHLNNENNFNKVYSTCDAVGNYNRNTYYDSNLYDLVPVKENTVKIGNSVEMQKRKEPKKRSIKCWPEKVRPKHRAFPTVANNNNYTRNTVREHCKKKRKPHAKSQSRKDIVMDKMAAKPIRFNSSPSERDIDLGQIYSKPVTKQKKQNDLSTSTETRNVGTCSPTTLTNTDCQTATSDANVNCQSPENPPEDKTEAALNQIKDILQSVLTEIKTNSKLTTSVELAKKDAVVQKGPSQGNVFGASQLLHSYTYSPYNMNAYLASCSHQITSNACTLPQYPGFQGSSIQQYPLLIQPQRCMCTNCLRNITKTIKKRATSASTNTEQNQERNKVTERLIKEIYNSMALNLEIPSSKDDSVGDNTRPKQTAIKKSVDSVRVEKDKESKRFTNAISEIFRNKCPQDSSTMTTNTATTLFTSKGSNETKFKGSPVVKKAPVTKRMHSQRNSSTTENEEPTDYNVINENTEESSSETGTDDVEPTRNMKKEKSSIFKKMLKIFQPKQYSRRRVKGTETASESDSDDYQTVYSHKVATPKPKTVPATTIRPHSRVIYFSKQPQQKKPAAKSLEKHSRNSPYMEQEYRRRWDEKLMFHENQRKRYSTDASRDTTEYRKNRPVYYQNYEARAVLVNPVKQMPVKSAQINNNNNNNYNKNKQVNIPMNTPNVLQSRRVDKQVNTSNSRNANGGNVHKPHYIISKNGPRRSMIAAKGLAWMKKHTMCQQWKELIRDS